MKYISFRNKLNKILNLIEKLLVIIGILLFGIIVIINGVEIFSRTILDHSFFWVQEFTVVICGYIIFLGITIIFKRKGNIFISIIYNLYPKSIRSIISLISDLLIMSFLIISIKASYSYVLFVRGGYTQTIKLPWSLVYLPILLGFLLIFVVLIDWIVDDIEKFYWKKH